MARSKYYVNVTIKREVYEELKRRASSLGISVPDYIALLVNQYDLAENVKKLLEVLSSRILPVKSMENPGYRTNTVTTHYPRKKRTAIDILKEQGVIFESSIARKLKDPNSFFNKLKKEGALIIETDTQRIAVDPGFWENFLDKLESISSYDEEFVKKTMNPREYELFEELRLNGLVYFDRTKNKWVLLEELAQ